MADEYENYAEQRKARWRTETDSNHYDVPGFPPPSPILYELPIDWGWDFHSDPVAFMADQAKQGRDLSLAEWTEIDREAWKRSYAKAPERQARRDTILRLLDILQRHGIPTRGFRKRRDCDTLVDDIETIQEIAAMAGIRDSNCIYWAPDTLCQLVAVWATRWALEKQETQQVAKPPQAPTTKKKPGRPPGKKQAERRKKILPYAKKGLFPAEIAEKTGFPAKTISDDLRFFREQDMIQ